VLVRTSGRRPSSSEALQRFERARRSDGLLRRADARAARGGELLALDAQRQGREDFRV
jgi:hypothetical protein